LRDVEQGTGGTEGRQGGGRDWGKGRGEWESDWEKGSERTGGGKEERGRGEGYEWKGGE